MNRPQWIALIVALANLVLILVFPPFDYVTLQRGYVPTFSGFHFILNNQSNRVLNQPFLSLEIFVVLTNAAIAWLLLRPRTVKQTITKTGNAQRNILLLVAANLVTILLFPPFENYISVTKAVLPTFEGFYFIFGENSQRQIVTPLLYIEIALILVNGALCWLFFGKKASTELTPEQIRELAKKLQLAQKH